MKFLIAKFLDNAKMLTSTNELEIEMVNEPTADKLNSLLTAAIECEGIGGSSMETLYELYEARMKKFSWVGKEECNLRFALDAYLEYRGYKSQITTEVEEG